MLLCASDSLRLAGGEAAGDGLLSVYKRYVVDVPSTTEVAQTEREVETREGKESPGF